MFKKYAGLLLFSLVFVSCSGKSKDIVATVGGKHLTIDEVLAAAAAEPYNTSALLRTELGRKKMTEGLIDLKVLELEARKYGIDRDPAVRKKIEDLRSKVILTEYLKKMQEEGGLEPKEEDIKRYYEENIADYVRPSVLKISQILVTDSAKADSVMKAVTSGVSFERMAKEQSEDPASKDKGGNMGFIRRGELIDELEKAAFGIKKVGQVTGPVPTPFGYHILKLVARTGLDEIPYDKARESIRKRLQKKVFDDYISRAKKNYNIKIFDNVLSNVVAPQGTSAK